jgi:hypothetical protein
MTTFHWILLAAIVLGLIGHAIDWYRSAGRASLYTRNGSPVNVDQVAEERRARLQREQTIHDRFSPHAQSLRGTAAKGFKQPRDPLTREELGAAAQIGPRRPL